MQSGSMRYEIVESLLDAFLDPGDMEIIVTLADIGVNFADYLAARGMTYPQTLNALISNYVDPQDQLLPLLRAALKKNPGNPKLRAVMDKHPHKQTGGSEELSENVVRIPSFHRGSIVPLEFFIDREHELEEAKELIKSRQSFLIIGRRRAGKTSFGQELINAIMLDLSKDGRYVLGSTLDPQKYSRLDEHALIELERHVSIAYDELCRKKPKLFIE